jgi:hypothetical protein
MLQKYKSAAEEREEKGPFGLPQCWLVDFEATGVKS